MFKAPNSFEKLLEKMKDTPGLESNASTVAFVELAFKLVEILGLIDEPVRVVPALLSQAPVYHTRLKNLTKEQLLALANARILVPYSATSSWDEALRRYLEVDNYLRDYDFSPNNLEEQIVNAARCQPTRYPIRQKVYQECLTTRLPYDEVTYKYPSPDKLYQFEAVIAGSKLSVPVKFMEEQVELAHKISNNWLKTERERKAIKINIKEELTEIARYLDAREIELKKKYGLGEPQWEKRLEKIRYRPVIEDKKLGLANETPLIIQEFTHLAGMVASGKTTLAQLITAYLVHTFPLMRTTIVVGDSASAVKLANQINWWFRNDPEKDAPVAVPLLGRTTRNSHLISLHESEDYQLHLKHNRPHWGERWLATACPLQALVKPEELNYNFIQPGHEPCNNIRPLPQKEMAEKSKSLLCPLFAICPSQQLYRDMEVAQVWITTPGAMAQSAPPRHFERRKIKLGEIIYEQSDLVIFDEVETIMDWFDRVYATHLELTNGKDGIFDRLESAVSNFLISADKRSLEKSLRRWLFTQRETYKPVTNILLQLNEGNQHKILEKWVERNTFTAYSLFRRLARRLLGLKEFDERNITKEQRQKNIGRTNGVLHIFESFLATDPLRPTSRSRSSEAFEKKAVLELVSICKLINSTGESASDNRIHTRCKKWILKYVPEIKSRLNEQKDQPQSNQAKGRRVEEIETLDTLAHRLQFTLDVALLDYHTRIVFNEWYNSAKVINEFQPYQRIPTALSNILPIPPTGRQFGVYATKGASQLNNDDNTVKSRDSNHLSMFVYENIGRSYVLDFHKLRQNLEGKSGPNVLALSGTSYLPDSSRFHISHLPIGVLEPEIESQEAIEKSRFFFLPMYGKDLKPMRVSGKADINQAVKELARALAGNYLEKGGVLRSTISELVRSGKENPELWADRERILLLVNSYSQAHLVANELKKTELKDITFFLSAGKGSNIEEYDDSEEPTFVKSGSIIRSDIENFAQTNGKILVAPIGAIGRGFNILNSQGKAAFGAVYFLTRPMPHPFDTQAIAQELNRRVLDWSENPDFVAWKSDGVYNRAQKLRQMSLSYWRMIEARRYYRDLEENEEFMSNPRRDLAATTAGLIIQAVGRLLRGGVPFLAYFTDAAWGAFNKKGEQELATEENSLLEAVLGIMEDYSNAEGDIGKALYGPLADALVMIEGFRRSSDKNYAADDNIVE